MVGCKKFWVVLDGFRWFAVLVVTDSDYEDSENDKLDDILSNVEDDDDDESSINNAEERIVVKRMILVLNQFSFYLWFGESKETWDDMSQLLAGFITENLYLPYSFDQMDMQISKTHRTNDDDCGRRNNKSEPRPIIAQFVNLRVSKEVLQKIIHLNSRNQLKFIINQMFSKELTKCRYNALIKRKY